MLIRHVIKKDMKEARFNLSVLYKIKIKNNLNYMIFFKEKDC